MNIIIIWLCSITITQCIHGKVITVDNSGSNYSVCCTNGTCVCNSLYNALSSIESNTVINITSLNVTLNTDVKIRQVYNVMIIGTAGTMVMCNNTGSLQCESCHDIHIEGITWNQCGHGDIGIIINATYNIYIINCTFQKFNACVTVDIYNLEGALIVINSKFMFNTVSDASLCSIYSSLRVLTYNTTSNITIQDSLFYHNGNMNQEKATVTKNSLICDGPPLGLFFLSVLVKNTSFIYNGIGTIYINDKAKIKSNIVFNKVNISDNKFGATVYTVKAGSDTSLDINSSHFERNDNGALLILGNKNKVNVFNTTFASNKASSDMFSAVFYFSGLNNIVNISLCNFNDNVGGNSIVYLAEGTQVTFPLAFSNVSITSSNFTGNKLGSVLQISKCFLKFYSDTIFQDNSAKSGTGIYIAESSQISVEDGSTVQFINNTASLRGGAMYIDLTNCYDHGIVFTNLTRYNSISFINNSATHSGHSIYFNIPDSCNVIRDTNNSDSAAYAPYKFNYIQSPNTIGPEISTSPFEIELCSPINFGLMSTKTTKGYGSECVTEYTIMLGHSLYFNPTVHDYFKATAEATKFKVNCSNCGLKYRLLEKTILAQNGLRSKINILSIAANVDVENDTTIILSISSLLSPEFKQLATTLSLTLSPCYNGFLFNEESQQCECYDEDDYLQCEEDRAHIRLGYWFGVFSGKYTFSICHNDYCNFFSHRRQTSDEFYKLPEEINDQCNSYRTGVACGQCSEGYSLAYNSPDCIKCSSWMTVLAVLLTILYWTVIIAILMLFGAAYFLHTRQLSPGYLYGIAFFYSIVDILLLTNLNVTSGVFYTATILSSFTKLNPQFLGKLCFIENLDAIDQQFIHYCHVVFVFIILMVIYIMAKCNSRAMSYVNRGIVPVTCFVLLFSYTSLTSTSLLLLRAVKHDNIDGMFTYLSPHLKYFANRHAAYASVAILCVLLVTIGFPLLLVTEPLLTMFDCNLKKNACKKAKQQIKGFLEKWACCTKIKQLLDKLQDCYKDQYRWFAAYYLICRLVMMLIIYFANGDYNYMIYYLQTACVVITMTHIWIQPYKNDTLNLTDTVVLLIMVLIVNISAFRFTTSTTVGIAISLIIAPLLLVFGVGVKKSLVSMIKKNQPNDGDGFGHNARAVLK